MSTLDNNDPLQYQSAFVSIRPTCLSLSLNSYPSPLPLTAYYSNLFGTQFGGADLRGARFDNAILGNASFGKGADGQWANLAGTHFEGALLSSSDVERLCVNPTLDADVKKFELGCRSGR